MKVFGSKINLTDDFLPIAVNDATTSTSTMDQRTVCQTLSWYGFDSISCGDLSYSRVLKVDDLGFNILHHAVKSYSELSSLLKMSTMQNEVLKDPIHFINKILKSPWGKQACLQLTHDELLTPLHLCCRSLVPDEVTRMIATVNPEVIDLQDEEGDTPLHSAFRYGASNETINQLIELAYSCSQKGDLFDLRNDEGDSVLHTAISHEASAQSIQLLLDAYPQGISALDAHERSPLHLAAKCGRYDLIEVMINSHACIDSLPSLLRMRDESGLTPLYILWNQITEHVVQNNFDPLLCEEELDCIAMIIRSASCCTVESDDAAMNKLLLNSIQLGSSIVPGDYISFLIKNHPYILRQPDMNGYLPLHHAVSNYKLDQFEIEDDHVDSPYDDSIQHPASHFTKKLEACNLYKETFSNKVGQCNEHFFNIILDEYPAAALVENKQGKTPFHLAIEYGMPWESINGLLDIHPLAVGKPDPTTGLLPFMSAAASKCYDSKESINTIFRLLQKSPHSLLFSSGINDDAKINQPRMKRRRV